MPTAELTLELPVEAYVQRLKDAGRQPLHPDILTLTGLVPEELNAKTEHTRRLLEKHR